MIFRCPCGYVNELNYLPADRRVKCEGCRKVWVVSKKGKKRSRLARDVVLGAAGACVLAPALWPGAPVAVAGLVGRIFLLRQRYRVWARAGLAAVMAVVWGAVASMGLALGVMVENWLGLRGRPEGLMQLGEYCLGARILMDQWAWLGWLAFGILVAFAGVAPVVAKRVRANGLDRGQRITLVVLTVLAAIGPFALLGHGSVDGPGAGAERRLQDRYVAATERNRAQQRRTAMVNSIAATLAKGVSAEDRAAFHKELASIASAAEAVGLDERYLQGPGNPTAAPRHSAAAGAGATTQASSGGMDDDLADLVWHAMTMGRWSQEVNDTVAAESAGPGLDRAQASAMQALQRVAATQFGLSLVDDVDAIDAYFTGTINFAFDHFSASQIDSGMNRIALGICHLSAARELNIRETVNRLYQQAMVANTTVPWQPTSKTRSPTAKTIIIHNNGAEEATFWAVGPIVKETVIPSGEEAQVTLDELEYRAVVSVGSATPIVLDLGYGAGKLEGEVTKEETWETR